MTDTIQELPTDNHPLTPEETILINTIFKRDSSLGYFITEIKPHILYGLLFMAFMMFDINTVIKTVVPRNIQEKPYVIVSISTVLFIIATFMGGILMETI